MIRLLWSTPPTVLVDLPAQHDDRDRQADKRKHANAPPAEKVLHGYPPLLRPGESYPFRSHRSMAQVMADEARL